MIIFGDLNSMPWTMQGRTPFQNDKKYTCDMDIVQLAERGIVQMSKERQKEERARIDKINAEYRAAHKADITPRKVVPQPRPAAKLAPWLEGTRKVCTKCGRDLPVEAFAVRSDNNMPTSMCRECLRRAAMSRSAEQRNASLELRKKGLRRCPRCGVIKPLDAFYGQRGLCKECKKAYSRNYMKYYLADKKK